METPSRDQYVKARVHFASALATAEWEIQYGRPQRAREMAHAWVGIIRLSTMGPVKGYTSGYRGHPYEPPKVGVAPATPKIGIDVEWFHTTFLPAGTIYHYPYAHREIVAWQLGDKGAKNKIIGDPESFCDPCEIALPNDRVLLTWHELSLNFHDPKYPPPPYFRLLRLNDVREHEIERLNSSIVRVFPTEAAAKLWADTRAAELRAEHDRNHAQQCRDKACAKRGHIYVPRDD